MTKEKPKPYQILLRGYEIKKMEDLIKHYEKSIYTRFARADIIRIALNQLYEKIFKNKQR